MAARVGKKGGCIELGIASEAILAGKRHFVYPYQAGPDDSGSAAVSLHGMLSIVPNTIERIQGSS